MQEAGRHIPSLAFIYSCSHVRAYGYESDAEKSQSNFFCIHIIFKIQRLWVKINQQLQLQKFTMAMV